MRTKMPGMNPVSPNTSYLFDNRTDKILVEQRCEDCKKQIEKVVLSIVGVNKAIWDKTTGMLVLNFNPTKTTLDTIEQAIANAGHSTPNYKAKIEFYTISPKCCKV